MVLSRNPTRLRKKLPLPPVPLRRPDIHPRDRNASKGSPLPLVIRAHGGGFIVNNPSLDDIMARYIADHAKCCVVSIDYGKAPQAKFPVAYEDVVALSLAAIEDPELPIDRSRVVLCGSSAGGNLLLVLRRIHGCGPRSSEWRASTLSSTYRRLARRRWPRDLTHRFRTSSAAAAMTVSKSLLRRCEPAFSDGPSTESNLLCLDGGFATACLARGR